MLIRIIVPNTKYEKVFFFHQGNQQKTTTKANLSLFITRTALKKILTLLTQKRFYDTSNENLDIIQLPSSWPPQWDSIQTKSGLYQLKYLGIAIDFNSVTGHLEIKYTKQTGTKTDEDKFIINFHVYPDRNKDRDLQDYIEIIGNQIKTTLNKFERKASASLEHLSVRNFKHYQCYIANASKPYYSNLIIYNHWMAQITHRQTVQQKQTTFDTRMSSVQNWNYLDDDYYYLSPTEITGHQLLETGIISNLAFLSLVAYSRFFMPQEETEEIDDFSTWPPSTAYVDNWVELELDGVIFAGTDLRGLDLSQTKFKWCDFTHADLRGCSINLKKMDDATLVTLSRAKLFKDVEQQLNDQLQRMEKQQACPRLATHARQRLFSTRPQASDSDKPASAELKLT